MWPLLVSQLGLEVLPLAKQLSESCWSVNAGGPTLKSTLSRVQKEFQGNLSHRPEPDSIRVYRHHLDMDSGSPVSVADRGRARRHGQRSQHVPLHSCTVSHISWAAMRRGPEGDWIGPCAIPACGVGVRRWALWGSRDPHLWQESPHPVRLREVSVHSRWGFKHPRSQPACTAASNSRTRSDGPCRLHHKQPPRKGNEDQAQGPWEGPD